MNAPTDWATALAILAAGLILGSLVFFIARRRKASAATKRSELEIRRDSLVQQLRDLGDDPAADERAWLEKETAEVLRLLDRLPTTPSEPQPVAKPRTATAGFVWGVICTLLTGGVVYYASTFLRGDSSDVDAQIVQAKDAFARNDLMAAFKQTNSVLAKNPDEPRALTYNAVVRLSMGEMEKATAMLERATQRDPKLLDAWVALAQARLHAGQPKEAAAAIDAAIAQHPEEEKRLREVFSTMQTPSATTADLPPDHPPMPGHEAMTSAPPTASSQPIHITLSLDPSAAPRGGVIYVIARGTAAGHPVAVRRIDTNAFPVTLDLGTSDSMMGNALPEKVRIEARLDSDGDAGTNDPADLHASADGVRAGATVELTLARGK
ncbi:MAG TPA: tetratricopeptide repeat protein [Thermoanaerobaculia bacterium]|nr:tetratricopeptide repeat protein [Thermoanaerobaculia bacterium]